ncbi:MAG: hypothetical protein M3238_00175 [Actinomycetota bacterium]|nr:hypothetical protein [Actinomycetota bacterium]
MESSVARRLWELMEPYHALVYFEPQAKATYESVGLKGYWMGYFASRSAALGPVPADVVIATFYNFHPDMVRRAIPDAWRFSTPERVLEARYRVADTALRRLLGDDIRSSSVTKAAALALEAAVACSPIGRPLFAGHAALEWPSDPHLVLWHAATLLREFRGDGHVATLLTEEIDGCEANVLITAEGRVTAETQRLTRRWSEEDWAQAVKRLQNRDLLDDAGELTSQGKELRARVEARTDELALAPCEAIGTAYCDDLVGAMHDVIDRISQGDGVPFPNPMGLPKLTRPLAPRTSGNA